MLLIGRIADLILGLAHIFKLTIIQYNNIFYQSNQHMEIYQLSKYENIGDRLKRLTNTAKNVTTNQKQYALPHEIRANRYGNLTKRNHQQIDPENRVRLMENLKYPKMMTSQNEFISEDQPQSRRRQLISPRQSNKTQRKSVNSRNIQYKMRNTDAAEQTNIPYTLNSQVKRGENKANLSRVKSNGSIKIENILESFNNYRQNKEKFLLTLGKSYVNTEDTQSQTTKILESQKQIFSEERQTFFKPIDNIWNEDYEEDVAPKFQRSLNTLRGQFQEISDIFNAKTDQKGENYQNKPNRFSKSKNIGKNPSKYQEYQNAQKNSLNTLLSPRGQRIPGKICKNIDKTFTRQSQTKEK